MARPINFIVFVREGMARPINLIVMFREGMVKPIYFTMVVLLSCPIPFFLTRSHYFPISLDFSGFPFSSLTLYFLVSTLSQLSPFHKLFILPIFLVFFIFNFYFTINTTNDLPTFQTVKREIIYNMLMFTSTKKKLQLFASPKLDRHNELDSTLTLELKVRM